MKTTYKYIVTAILVGAIAIPALAFGQEVGGQNTNGADVNPSSNGGLSVGGTETNGSDSGLSTGGTNTNGSDVNPSGDPGLSTGGTNTNGSDTSSDTPSNPDNGGSNNSGSNGNGGNGGGGRRNSSSSTSTLPVLGDIGQCSYLSSYLKLGGNNPQDQVLKLQAFLASVENLPVTATGIFDEQTFEGVKSFQAKYVTEILAPWGVTTPTGQVWYTTKKKVNEVFCKANFALTPAQIAEIEAYRLGITNGAVDALGNPLDPNATGTIPLLPEVGNASGTNSQTAALGDLSIFQKFVNFLKWLFHR